jgi:hypothetical protein
MRKDLPKKFIEPCGGKKSKFPRGSKRLKVDNDGNSLMPQGMRKAHDIADHGNEHYSGEDFALMRRFLRSRIGKPWDAVYSEICKKADGRSFEGHHLRDWLGYFIEFNCTMGEGGTILDDQGREVRYHHPTFYVHPENGTLEYSEAKSLKKRG